MDLLQECAAGFERLLPYQYHIVAGRKGKTLEFTISFDRADFHHLAGWHKLTDNIRFLTGRRANIMQEILSGKLTFAQTQQSVFFQQMEPRLKPLVHLEEFLDSNEIIFRYNAKVHTFSVIQADYLLQMILKDSQCIYFWPSAQGMIPRCAALSSQKRRRTMLRASRATHCWRKKKSTSSQENSPFSTKSYNQWRFINHNFFACICKSYFQFFHVITAAQF